MKKFTQTIIAIALATAGAQAFAATKSGIAEELRDKTLSSAEIVTANKETNSNDSGPIIRTPTKIQSDFMILFDRFEKEAMISRFGTCWERTKQIVRSYPSQTTNNGSRDAAQKKLMDICMETEAKISISKLQFRSDAVMPELQVLSDYYKANDLKEPAPTMDAGPMMRAPAKTISEQAMNSTEVQYRDGHSDLSGLSGQKMVTKPSKLSKDAEMELVGYERVGSYKSDCETNFRKSLDSNKELKSEACTIYKERGKDLPSVSIN